MYEKALDILQWGRQEWDGVPKDDRGAVFEDTFIRGVRGLHLDAYMKASQPQLHSWLVFLTRQSGLGTR